LSVANHFKTDTIDMGLYPKFAVYDDLLVHLLKWYNDASETFTWLLAKPNEQRNKYRLQFDTNAETRRAPQKSTRLRC